MTDKAEDRSPETSSSESDAKPAESTAMTMLEHLAELRSTLMWAFGMAFAAAIAAWFVSDFIIETLFAPIHKAGEETLYFQQPMEGFLLKLKASAVIGLLIVLPLILYKLYGFVMPGLLPKEKRVVTPLLVSATGLFYAGVIFCYTILLPLVIRFALSFATESLQPWITASSYFDLAARLCLAFGLLFELPMVVFALSWVGVVDPKVLLKGWRYALVVILMVAAVLTPPDIISQALLAGPVMVLYIVSVLISMVVRKRQRKAKEERKAADDAEDQRLRELEIAEREAKARAAEESRRAEQAAEQAAERRARGRAEVERRRAEREESGSEETPKNDPTAGDEKSSDPESSGTGADERPIEPRPAPGAQPRLDEAPDRDEDEQDPPWVRRPGDGADGNADDDRARDGDDDPDRDGESN